MKNTTAGTTTHARFRITTFTNCMTNHGTGMNVYNWIPPIKNGLYKEPVEKIRQLTAEGKDDEARVIKNSLTAMCASGYLPQGRKETSPMQLSELFMIDYDEHNKEVSEKVRDSLKGRTDIICAYLTPRYGLRLIVKLPSTVTLENFDLYAKVVLLEMDKLTGMKHDEQASTRVHLNSASYDPDLWYTSPDKVTDFPVEEKLKENEMEIMKALKDSSYKSEPEVGNYTLDDELNDAYQSLLRQDKTPFSKAQIDDMLTRFMGRCPLVEHSRNRNLLRLGQYAYYKRFSWEELEYLMTAVHSIIGCREYNLRRIRECICWGYRHNDKQEICQTLQGAGSTEEEEGDEGEMSQKSQKSHPHRGFSQEPAKLADCQGNYDEVVDKACPTFPDTVYENLPPFFSDLIFETPNNRDMDMALMGNITAASGFMPKVSVQVRDQDYSANLFFLGIAPAGSGKSIINKSRLLFTYLKTKFTMNNKNRKAKYEEEKNRWDLEERMAIKEKRLKNLDLKPNPYVEKEILHPAQTSRSALIKAIANNPQGFSILTSELDILNESLDCDAGNHSAELRCMASNEPISCKYIKTEETIEQEHPCATLLATGTQAQMVTFFGNTHDGMESRCLIMLSKGFPDWISWGSYNEAEANNKKEAYFSAAKKAVQIYEFLEKYPTHVTIPSELRGKCDKFFSYYTKRVQEEGYENLRCIINRSPIHVARICAILASLRKVEMGYQGIEIQATEEDMKVALGIVVTLLKHSCLATTLFKEDHAKYNTLKTIFKQEDIFHELPKEFTTTDILNALIVQAKYSRSTSYRIIKRWQTEGYISNVRYGVYRKTGKQSGSL